jgi:uncharacterized protein (DUF1800 family)
MIPKEQVELPVSLSMTPYAGPWTKDEAAHLLRRTLFGPTFLHINETVQQGLDTSVNNLLAVPDFTYPLTFLPEETITPYGESWVNQVYPSDPTLAQYHENARRDSLGAWLIGRINTEGFSIHEKMCLFWHNHFANQASPDSRATFDYFKLIQTHALGNFKQLVRDMTVNPCMLYFLNGFQNNKFSPNENYSRELLELYSIGKGPQIGVGDYTNYTEEDVLQGAKILTGWTVKGALSDTENFVTAVFNPELHDSSDKQLSSKFANEIVANSNETEYLNYIDIIFEQTATAKFICQKIYRWFVNYDITEEVNNTIISELAQTLITNNYEIIPVLNQLLKSEHFYDVSLRGTIIKNPLEEIFSIFNATSSYPYNDLNVKSRLYLNCGGIAAALGMNGLVPPNVGGWPAYYQAPNYSKLWANSSYIKLRFDFASYVTLYGGLEVDGRRFAVNLLGFLDGLSAPSNATQIIEDMVLVFCPKGLSVDKKTNLKTILLNGLPDFEWSVQYAEYIADPTNPTFSDPIKQRVALTLDQLFKQPEFQTI